MENVSLYEVIDAVKGEFLLGDPHFPVETISTDTRTVKRGDYYFALQGKNYDGHDFLRVAIGKGVKGLIISRQDIDLGKPFPYIPAIIRVADTMTALGDLASFYRKRFVIPFIAVTGSNGKTTVKEMLTSILGKRDTTLSNIGNFNNFIGVPKTLFDLGLKHKYAVIEIGTSFPGEIQRLADIVSPNIGIVTNIGMSHLEGLKDLEGVLAEKRSLLDRLPKDGYSIINSDDPYLNGIMKELHTNVITFGLTNKAWVYADKLQLWPGLPKFNLCIGGQSIPIELPVHGQFNVYNALAAAAAAKVLGISFETIKAGLENYEIPKMRMNVINTVSGVTVINDAYNANPSSMRESLKGLVQSFPDRDKILVLGDMHELGGKSKLEHHRLGEYIATLPVNKILFYGPQMESAFLAIDSGLAKHFTNEEDLIAELKNAVGSQSVVFFKASRVMKLENILNKVFPESEF